MGMWKKDCCPSVFIVRNTKIVKNRRQSLHVDRVQNIVICAHIRMEDVF